MNSERDLQSAKRRRLASLAMGFAFCVLTPAFSALAKPSQEDVFQSIKQNVGQTTDDNGKGMAILLAGVGALIMVMLAGAKIRRRQSAPKVVDRPKKLIREVMKLVPLKPRELKQLKILVEETRDTDTPVQSPLTLLLCPSVLSKAVKSRPTKVDRAVVAQVVRKMALDEENAKARRRVAT